jgi:hypothetical protein
MRLLPTLHSFHGLGKDSCNKFEIDRWHGLHLTHTKNFEALLCLPHLDSVKPHIWYFRPSPVVVLAWLRDDVRLQAVIQLLQGTHTTHM